MTLAGCSGEPRQALEDGDCAWDASLRHIENRAVGIEKAVGVSDGSQSMWPMSRVVADAEKRIWYRISILRQA